MLEIPTSFLRSTLPLRSWQKLRVKMSVLNLSRPGRSSLAKLKGIWRHVNICQCFIHFDISFLDVYDPTLLGQNLRWILANGYENYAVARGHLWSQNLMMVDLYDPKIWFGDLMMPSSASNQVQTQLRGMRRAAKKSDINMSCSGYEHCVSFIRWHHTKGPVPTWKGPRKSWTSLYIYRNHIYIYMYYT